MSTALPLQEQYDTYVTFLFIKLESIILSVQVCYRTCKVVRVEKC